MLSPLGFVLCSKAGMISPDCRSKTFDTSANGYVRGEGAGAVVLERQGAGDGDDDEAMSVSPCLGEEGKDGLARGLEEDVFGCGAVELCESRRAECVADGAIWECAG